jgi:hypothetical protein
MTLVEWVKAFLKGDVESTDDVFAVCVGMESSRSAGSCPGAGVDALRMRDLLGRHAKAGLKLLTNSQATASAVKAALSEALGHKLAILFYSGHGGRDEKDKNAAFDPDMRDEYLCLYDKMMRDDEVWSILQQAKGRVVCIFDCCHSGTMYRSAAVDGGSRFEIGGYPFTLRKYKSSLDMEMETLRNQAADNADVGMSHEEIERIYSRGCAYIRSTTPDLLVWSACQENEYSYGAGTGGIFTNALLSAYGKDRSYGSVWKRICGRMKREPNTPVRTVFGKGFGGKVFR